MNHVIRRTTHFESNYTAERQEKVNTKWVYSGINIVIYCVNFRLHSLTQVYGGSWEDFILSTLVGNAVCLSFVNCAVMFAFPRHKMQVLEVRDLCNSFLLASITLVTATKKTSQIYICINTIQQKMQPSILFSNSLNPFWIMELLWRSPAWIKIQRCVRKSIRH